MGGFYKNMLKRVESEFDRILSNLGTRKSWFRKFFDEWLSLVWKWWYNDYRWLLHCNTTWTIYERM